MTTNTIEKTDTSVEMTRTFNATREQVFAAWADPEQRKAWSGCNGSTCISYTHDFETGGDYRQVLEIPDCGQVVIVGTFTKIEEPAVIAYSMNCEGMDDTPDSHVELTFTEEGGKTQLHLRHTDLVDAEACEAVSGGHQASFDRLEEILH